MKSKPLRIVFMGTPDFAVGILDALVQNQYHIVGVITVADKPAGRGKQITSSPVKNYALEHQIPVLQPTNLKNEVFLAELKALQPDLQIVVAFRMLPQSVWSLPKYGTFNLHASLLPSYRGAAPINWAIINGETTTGVTTFFIDDKIDTGAVILQEQVPIELLETAGSLHDKLMKSGEQLVIKTVDLIASENVSTFPQPEMAPSNAPKLFKENCKINWQSDMKTIQNFIRGLSPYPTAWTDFENDEMKGEFKIFNAHFLLENHTFSLYSIVCTKNEIKVALPTGFMVIDELQMPGRKKMDAKSLLNGFRFSTTARVV
jgi:methionyl-tRNA formyltransferase